MPTCEAKCRVEFDLARPEDDGPLRALLRETPMGGDIRVAFLREPNFFHTTGIQGSFAQVLVARLDGRVVGVGTRATRPGYVNGQRVETGYLADLRLHPSCRGGTTLVRGYRFLRTLHEDGRTEIYGTVIVDDNRPALGTIAANRAGLPSYTDLGRILTPMIPLQCPMPTIQADIVRGSPELLPAIVARLNEDRRQLAPAYHESDFLGGRFRGFQLTDFRVLRRGSRIAGVMGTWDQNSFRQTVVTGYGGRPAPGAPLRYLHVAFAATDDLSAFRALLRRIYNESMGGVPLHLVAGVHERDPRAEALREYPHTPFAGRLFAVTFDGPPELDPRLPHVEPALL